MPLGPLLAALVAISTSLAWSILLIVDPQPFASGPAVMLAITTIVVTLIAVAGLLLARSQWAAWLLVAIAAAQMALAVATPIDRGWQAVAILAALALVGLAAAAGRHSQRSSNSGPPSLAIVLLLSLIAFPALVAVSNANGIAALAVLGSGLMVLAAIIYSRGGIMALWTLRSVVPLGAILASSTTPFPAAALVLAAGIALSVLAWAPVIHSAAAPLAPLRSPGYRIPPELAPREI
ncbi:MAG: hypothetical protein OES13_10310, partial [Acidimicrobiia bacterium]|nr:hypothetical protein [Acidimicrobiia bacterium]